MERMQVTLFSGARDPITWCVLSLPNDRAARSPKISDTPGVESVKLSIGLSCRCAGRSVCHTWDWIYARRLFKKSGLAPVRWRFISNAKYV